MISDGAGARVRSQSSGKVKTVFHLLGAREDVITYSLGWGLSRSEALTRSVLREAESAQERRARPV